MEINITSLLELDQFELSHSIAEGGENAGQNTWRASKQRAIQWPCLMSEEARQAMRDFARSSGGWDAEEIEAWSNDEVQALFLQWVAGDTGEAPAKLEGYTFEERWQDGTWFYSSEAEPDMETGPFDNYGEAYQQACDEYLGRPGQRHTADSLDEIDWLMYEFEANQGRISSNMFKANDGQIYFSLSN